MKISTCAVRLLSSSVAYAAVVSPGSPREPTISERGDEYTVFGKGHVLDERDYSLAEQHGVNLKEMRKHSTVERDGQEYTFWVNRAFSSEGKEKGHLKRGLSILKTGYRPTFTHDPEHFWFCNEALDVKNITNKISPSSKSVAEILAWARSNLGYFQVLPTCCKEHVPLIIAGSNDGANAVIKLKQHHKDSLYEFKLGTHDVETIVRESILKVKGDNFTAWDQIGSDNQPDFRMAARGGLRCITETEGVRLPENPWVDWDLTSYKNVPEMANVYPPGWKSNETTAVTTLEAVTPTSQAAQTNRSLVYPPDWKSNANSLSSTTRLATPISKKAESTTSRVYPPGRKYNEIVPSPSSAAATPKSSSSAEKTSSGVWVERSVPTLQPVVNILVNDILQPVFRTPTARVETPIEATPTTHLSALERAMRRML